MLALLMINRMNAHRRISARKRAFKLGKENENNSRNVYCRTCLATEGLEPIFFSKTNQQKRSSELKLVTGLEIKTNDGLSQKICTKCTKIINTALAFRKTSKQSEETLLSMVNTVTAKPKRVKLSKDDKPVLKVEIECENDYDLGDVYDGDGDDFQNDDGSEELKPDIKPMFKKSTVTSKSKRPSIPNASSYTCNICNKEFRMKATFKAHLRFHTNFCVCEACGKRCRNNNQLQEHKRARHGLGRIHKCAYCEYSSATKEALIIHERRHTGERPYVCDHCGASFHRRSNLVQHIAIHLPDKNFQCDLCPKRLKSKKFLQIHKHNAHTGKRYGYLCGICAHRFEKPNKVRAHARRVHGVPDEHQGPVARVQL